MNCLHDFPNICSICGLGPPTIEEANADVGGHFYYLKSDGTLASLDDLPTIEEANLSLMELTEFLIANQPQSKQELAVRILEKFTVVRK